MLREDKFLQDSLILTLAEEVKNTRVRLGSDYDEDLEVLGIEEPYAENDT